MTVQDYLVPLDCLLSGPQVTRLVTVSLEPGSAEVVLKSISKSLDKDSIRVDGIGPASVTEVSFQVTRTPLVYFISTCSQYDV